MLSEIGQLAVDVQIKIRARNTAKAARAVELLRYREEIADWYPQEGPHGPIRDDRVEASIAVVNAAQSQLTRARAKLRAAIDKYQRGGRQ